MRNSIRTLTGRLPRISNGLLVFFGLIGLGVASWAPAPSESNFLSGVPPAPSDKNSSAISQASGLHGAASSLVCLGVVIVLGAGVHLATVGASKDGVGHGIGSVGTALLSAAYIVICGASDILIKHETQENNGVLPLSPMHLVLAVEVGKLIVTFPIASYRFSTGSLGRPRPGDVLLAGRLMAGVAAIYSINNGLIFYIVAHVDFSRLSIWRQLTPIFTGLIWVSVFRRRLGRQRWVALGLLVLGTSLNSFGSAGSRGSTASAPWYDATCLMVLGVCLLSAIAGVANEYVLKVCGHLDIDFLCCILYSQTSVCSLVVLLGSSMFAGPATAGTSAVNAPLDFVGGILRAIATLCSDPVIFGIICLQVLFGFAVARVLRYFGCVPRAVINALKELTVVIVAPVFVQSQLNGIVVTSAIIVGVAAAVFTLAPPPERLDSPSAGEADPLMLASGKQSSSVATPNRKRTASQEFFIGTPNTSPSKAFQDGL